MTRRSLRVITPNNSATTVDAQFSGEPSVTVSVAQILPLLAEAMSSNRSWVKDFADDPVVISRDFYDVLLAYQRLRLTRAA